MKIPRVRSRGPGPHLRAPLPGFDSIFYLYWNRDVCFYKAGPLDHYLRHGWREGREPSAGFSGHGYLAANPDVRAAGVNPLIHFLEFGLAEGRVGWQKVEPDQLRSDLAPPEPMELLAPPREDRDHAGRAAGDEMAAPGTSGDEPPRDEVHLGIVGRHAHNDAGAEAELVVVADAAAADEAVLVEADAARPDLVSGTDIGNAHQELEAGPPARPAWPDNLVRAFPTEQVALDLFGGRWASALPVDGDPTGSSDLFCDERIAWMLSGFRPLAGFNVLELGPLEGAHTHMLIQAGAAHVLGIEANADAFLRCLVVKNLLSLDRAHFLLGDFERYLADRPRRFDLILASGVLYHLADPLKVLQDMIAVSDRIAIWSHFYDEALIEEAYQHGRPFTGRSWPRTLGNDTLTYHEHSYGPENEALAFRGGIRPASSWIELPELTAFFDRHGYRVTVGLETPVTPAGPAACLIAQR